MAEVVRDSAELSGYRDAQLIGALASAVLRAANHPVLVNEGSARMDRHTVVQTLHVLLDSTGEWDLDQPVGDPDEAMPKVALPAAIQ